MINYFTKKLRRRVRQIKQSYKWAVQNRRAARLFASECTPSAPPIQDLSRYEAKHYSQHGEDGILKAMFSKLGVTNKYCVEFGVSTGKECNSRYLIQRCKWTGLWMTANTFPKRPWQEIKHEFITAENINGLFKKYSVPREFDLLSIDIDGNDYWVWKALTGYKPRVVCMEYNAAIPVNEARTIAYDPKFTWAHTAYFGASLLALHRLGLSKGYTLVGCDSSGTNAFFVEQSLAAHFVPQEPEQLFRTCRVVRPDPRRMIEVAL